MHRVYQTTLTRTSVALCGESFTLVSMLEFQSYLLDVDGTLVDSTDAHAAAWAEVLTAHGYPIEPSRVRPYIGMGGDRLIEELAGIARDDKRNKAIGEERGRLFLETYLSRVRPLPGARELLLALRDRGTPFAIATAAKNRELEPLLAAGGIADLVGLRTTSSDVDESKPDPEVVEAALRTLGADPASTVMVGDTPYDVLAARGANVACIGFTTSGWTAKDLVGCTAVFAGPAELAQKLS